MKSFFQIFIALIFIFSCKNNRTPRTIEDISISTYTINDESIRAIHAVNEQKLCFVTSKGTIGFTDNGVDFKTYELKNDSILPNFRSMAFNGTDYFALSIGNPALLYRYSQNKHHLVYKEVHEKVFYDSMAFFDALNGIAMGDPIDQCLSIIRSNDGGHSWFKIPCEKLPKVSEGEAAFAASNTNLKILEKTVWIVTGGTKARVFRSLDAGETWEVFNTPIIQGSNTQGIYSVDFADQNNGIIIGGDYSNPKENIRNKAITKDGGKTWTLVANGRTPNYKSCVQYVPESLGKEIVAVGKTGISFSNDGGLTWKDLSKDSFYTIQFANRNTAWLGGNKKIGTLKFNR